MKADLRGFRWTLAPVERRLDGELETARLALARLQQQCDALRQAEHAGSQRRATQEALARDAARQDVLAGARAMRYLAGLEAERIAAAVVRTEAEARLAAARAHCAERQRALESVQALRSAAEKDHVQAQLRRDWKEADALWLAFASARKVPQTRGMR